MTGPTHGATAPPEGANVGYSLTDFEITEALASAERRGVRVRVVLDEEQAMRNKFSQFWMLAKGGVREVRLMPREAGIMVNDFGVIDRRFLYTGSSFLHTSVKESPKFANYLILPDERLAVRYQREFERLFERSRPRLTHFKERSQGSDEQSSYGRHPS